MNYSRDLNSMDPLPKVTGRKPKPELEDVKPTPEEQFERGNHKPLDEADKVARDTVAGGKSLWDAVDKAAEPDDKWLVEKVWEKPVVMGVMVDRRGTIALREYDSVHEACLAGLKILDEQCYTASGVFCGGGMPYSITLVDEGELWRAPDSWGGWFLIDVVRQSLGKFLDVIVSATTPSLDASKCEADKVARDTIANRLEWYMEENRKERDRVNFWMRKASAAESKVEKLFHAKLALEVELKTLRNQLANAGKSFEQVPEWYRLQMQGLKSDLENLSSLCDGQQARIAELECALRDGSGVIAGDESRVQLREDYK